MSFSSPIQCYHSPADPIRPDDTFKHKEFIYFHIKSEELLFYPPRNCPFLSNFLKIYLVTQSL